MVICSFNGMLSRKWETFPGTCKNVLQECTCKNVQESSKQHIEWKEVKLEE